MENKVNELKRMVQNNEQKRVSNVPNAGMCQCWLQKVVLICKTCDLFYAQSTVCLGFLVDTTTFCVKLLPRLSHVIF